MNQLSILDLIFSNDVAEERENTEKNGYEKDVDYLNREEVIKSLVRKKTPNTRMYSNIFDYPLKKSSVGRPLVEKIIDKIAKGVIEPILSTINDDNFEEVKSKLMKMIDNPVEIFARSFEVYMSNRINNSLLKPDTSSFAYLDDENYVKEVNKYFDELMKELVVKKAS